MRELHYENQGTNTYLVYEMSEQDTVDSMSLGMLTNNNIHGLAQTIFTQMDTRKFIKYNVSAKVSVQQFFTGSVNKKRLLGVFRGIVNAMLSAEDYMLDPATILLDLNYIFTDVSTCETDLICIPIADDEMRDVDLGRFFRNIMFNTQFDQTENCDHVAKIINYLNGTPSFSLNDFKKLLEEIASPEIRTVVKTAENQPQTVVPPEIQMKKQIQPANQTPSVQHPKTTLPPVSPDGGMSVQPKQAKAASALQETSQTTGPEISFFYLMQHYNKENAAAYKAQKKAKKKAAAKAKSQVAVQPVPAKKVTQPAAQPVGNFGFAVPGQASPAPVVQSQTQSAQQPEVISVPQIQSKVITESAQQSAYVSREVPQGQTMNFGETTVLGGSAIGETTVLTAAQNPAQMIAPHLIRKKNKEKISLNKPVFRIGKERSYADYFIGDNTAISRSHANFITREDEYFVIDTNSTNHTFVNGIMIQSNVETSIKHGDVVRLANEEFEFRLY